MDGVPKRLLSVGALFWTFSLSWMHLGGGTWGAVLDVPTMNTDADLGYSVMCFSSATIALNHFEEAGSILARPDGRASKGREASKRFLTQRAEVGFCLFCVIPIHVAAPSNYFVGEMETHKAQGTSLRTRLGPWDERRRAAAGWDWVDTVGELRS